MPIRALIVLLIVLNLGVAAWWISRPEAAPPALPSQPEGVPRLQLLSEVASPTTQAAPVAGQGAMAAGALVPAAPIATATVAIPTTPAEPAKADVQCHALGPFADPGLARAAAARLGGQVSRQRTREVPGKSAGGYNVFLPPSADRAAAQALAQRIDAAGFDDYLILNTGELANAIALGRYGSREAAERRQSALVAAGFAAQLGPVGREGPAQWWLDVEAGEGEGPRLQALAAAPQSRPLDCATLR